MDINLTQEQIKEFLENGYINVYMGDYRFYMELSNSSTNNIWYFELVKSKNGKTIQAYTHDISELELLKPKYDYDGAGGFLDHQSCPCGSYDTEGFILDIGDTNMLVNFIFNPYAWLQTDSD